MADFDCVLRGAGPANGFVLQSLVTAPIVLGGAVTIDTAIRPDFVGFGADVEGAFDVDFTPLAGATLTSATFVSYNQATGELVYNLVGAGPGNLLVEVSLVHTAVR